MKRLNLYFLLACLFAALASSCNTYYVAASSVPQDAYLNAEASEIAYNVPVGSVLLLKGKPKNGYVRARYHSNTNWNWISYSNIILVPNANPKYYDFSYANWETLVAANKSSDGTIKSLNTTGSGYNATIQTGSRGGKYYINKNGNKTYVKRSTPSGTVKHIGGRSSRGGRH